MCGRCARNGLPSRFTASLWRPSRYSSITPANFPGGGAAWYTDAVGSSFGWTVRGSTRPSARGPKKYVLIDEMEELLKPHVPPRRSPMGVLSESREGDLAVSTPFNCSGPLRRVRSQEMPARPRH